MKHTVLLPWLAAALVTIGYSPVQSSQASPPVLLAQSIWKQYTSTEGRFTVLMPGTPKTERQTQNTQLGPINIQAFAVARQQESVAYIVAYSDFPNNFVQKANIQKLLDGARDGALRAAQGKLLSQRNISLNGYPGREFEFVNPVGLITKNRMYLVNGRLYQVIVVTKQDTQKYLSRSIAGFLNSFKLLARR